MRQGSAAVWNGEGARQVGLAVAGDVAVTEQEMSWLVELVRPQP
ncbi:hypothetical protein [Streptomyces sp. NPDC097640]